MATENPTPPPEEKPQFEVTEQLRDLLFLFGEFFESRGYYDSLLDDIASGRVESSTMTSEEAKHMIEYRRSKGWKY